MTERASAPDTDQRRGHPACKPYAVLVVGMHRSGTSAIAAALGGLGLVMPRADDILGPGFGNDRGHFESMSLMEVSEEALRRLGGAWDDPPDLPADPSASDALFTLAQRAGTCFEDAFAASGKTVCWKDPRTALLLPFWRQVISRPIAAVLTVRHPVEVASSLSQRNALPVALSLSLWERYYRRALAGLQGLPVLVTSYEEAINSPASWTEGARTWLATLGIALDAGSRADGHGFETDLRHERHHPARELDDLLGSQRELYEELLSLRGTHEAFSHDPRLPESPWTTAVLEQRRDAARLWRAMEWLGDEVLGHLPAPPPPEYAVAPAYPLNATEDEQRYHEWLLARGEGIRVRTRPASEVPAAAVAPAAGPLFSVVIPCYRPPAWALDRAIASVLEQDFNDWEICLCDDASAEPALTAQLVELAALDPRLKTIARTANGGISTATNDALAIASGRFAVFLDHDDELHPTALSTIAKALEENPGTDLVYSDEDKIDDSGLRHMPSFKPDWSPDLLTSNAYMCHVLVVRRSLVSEVGGCRTAFDGAQDYDLMLRVTERTAAIVHIPEVLYHWRTLAGSASGDSGAKPWAFEAGRLALEDAARRRAIDATVVHHPKVPGSYHFIRQPKSGSLVSAIIPFRDEPALTAACYRSFIERPGYDNFELLLVDNDSALPETRALLEDLARDHRVRLLEAPGPFDWVGINNEAAKKARGELLLFLNNDVEARATDWLAAMVAQAERPEVGAVGARLLYPDGTIQHVGVVVGIGWGASHIQQGLGGDRPGYLSLTTVTRNFSAVTGACMMTRRSVFEEVGGFDENLPIAFNDIDYCLRLREQGLLVVHTPLAELVHHESKSRGHSDDAKEVPYFRGRWRSQMLAGDPYYNPNLGRFDNCCRLPTEEDEERWATFRSMLNESSTS